jgi:hypothetical protein
VGDFGSNTELSANQMILQNLKGGKPVKKYRKLLYCALALVLLISLAVPLASMNAAASDYTLTILNPMGPIVPLNNMPLADRQPLLDKLEAKGAQGPVRILLLNYQKMSANAPDQVQLWALAFMMRERWEAEYPGTEVIITPIAASGDPLQYGVRPASWDWFNIGALPWLGSPWGAKSGTYHIDGKPYWEEPFDRYHAWADSADFVLFGDMN